MVACDVVCVLVIVVRVTPGNFLIAVVRVTVDLLLLFKVLEVVVGREPTFDVALWLLVDLFSSGDLVSVFLTTELVVEFVVPVEVAVFDFKTFVVRFTVVSVDCVVRVADNCLFVVSFCVFSTNGDFLAVSDDTRGAAGRALNVLLVDDAVDGFVSERAAVVVLVPNNEEVVFAATEFVFAAAGLGETPLVSGGLVDAVNAVRGFGAAVVVVGFVAGALGFALVGRLIGGRAEVGLVLVGADPSRLAVVNFAVAEIGLLAAERLLLVLGADFTSPLVNGFLANGFEAAVVDALRGEALAANGVLGDANGLAGDAVDFDIGVDGFEGVLVLVTDIKDFLAGAALAGDEVGLSGFFSGLGDLLATAAVTAAAAPAATVPAITAASTSLITFCSSDIFSTASTNLFGSGLVLIKAVSIKFNAGVGGGVSVDLIS